MYANFKFQEKEEEEKDEETTGIDKTLKIDKETADSASDKDEEEATDSDLDKREDAVVGKTNVTVYGEIKKGYHPLHESTVGYTYLPQLIPNTRPSKCTCRLGLLIP